jgi:hypothetical protein
MIAPINSITPMDDEPLDENELEDYIDHVQVEIDTAKGQITCDEGIADLIKWLNSFPSVYTFYSCEGEYNKSPYVMFTISDMDDLNQITKDLKIGFYESIMLEVCHNFKRDIIGDLVERNTKEYQECKLFFHLRFDFHSDRYIESCGPDERLISFNTFMDKVRELLKEREDTSNF